MKKTTFLFVVLSAFVLLLSALNPLAVGAASQPFTVTPSRVPNNVDTSITIGARGGTSFTSDAVVILNGFGMLSTTFHNSKTLTAIVPAGVPKGNYVISITSTGGAFTCSSACLTVFLESPNARPRIAMSSHSVSTNFVRVNQEFKLVVDYKNTGKEMAYNSQVVFSAPDLNLTQTGGTFFIGNIDVNETGKTGQTFILPIANFKKPAINVDVTFNYYDERGNLYSDKFSITLTVLGGGGGGGGGGGNNGGGGGGGGGISATSTPKPSNEPQLIIPSYTTSVDPLQPGLQFDLTMTVKNEGLSRAKRVTMIIGGGTTGGSGGTPSAGGVSGGSGKFDNFAPLGSSNIQSLGNLGVGETLRAAQPLIVNVSTEPGAYPMLVTFSYQNELGETINDEQVITLLVYNLPKVDISFYRPLDPLVAGQPGTLPIQVANLGKRVSVLGNITVTVDDGLVENGTSLVGSVDPGLYFTLDAMFTPETPGSHKIKVVIDYTDDFNQSRTIEKTLEVEVEPEQTSIPTDEGMDAPVEPETFLQKIWRFILGLFGLDSAPSGGAPLGAFLLSVPKRFHTSKGNFQV